MSPISETRKQSMLRYAKTNLKRVPLDLPKDEYERIQEHVKQHGYKSLNGWIKQAISEKMKRDNAIPTNHKQSYLIGCGIEKIASAMGESTSAIMDSLIAKHIISDEDIIAAAAMNDSELKHFIERITAPTFEPTPAAEAPAAEAVPAEPPKRRRGRPRKNPIAE